MQKVITAIERLSNRAAKLDETSVESAAIATSSHGVRKAAGHLLAQNGCSQHQIMAIHGHTEAKTSEVYTKGVERWTLAADAMRTLEDMEW